MSARATGAWDLPHLDTGRCRVRFTRGLFTDDYPAIEPLVERRAGVAALVFVDEGVAAGRPELLDEVLARGMSPLVVPGGHAIRNGASAVAEMTAAMAAPEREDGGLLVAIGGAAMLESVDEAVAACGREIRHVRVPTTVHALVAALEADVLARTDAVLTDFELLRSLSDDDWAGGITPAIGVAVRHDRAFFRWLERQSAELSLRSLPAMAWVMYRTAELSLSRRGEQLGPPLLAGGARRGTTAALGVALGVTCSQQAGGLSQREWRRVIHLLETLDLPVWDARVTTPPCPIPCGMLDRIGSGIRAERLDGDSLAVAAELLRRWAQTPSATRPPRPA